MTNHAYPTSLSPDGLEKEIRTTEDTILRCRQEAEDRTAQAQMAEADGDRAQAMYYHQLAQVARNAALLAKSRQTHCKAELARRSSVKEFTVTVLCEDGHEYIAIGTATSASVAETNCFWACQERGLRPVSAEASLVH